MSGAMSLSLNPLSWPRHLDAPGAVAEGERLVAACRADRVPDELRPGGLDLVVGRAAAVDRHLVGDEPARDGGVVFVAALIISAANQAWRPTIYTSRRDRGRGARPGPSSRPTCGRR